MATTTNLTSLPTELHMHISSYLSYPDALALKHTNRHFYAVVYTGVHSKIDWLLWRFERKLECPRNEDCSLRTDESFCKSKTVRKIMERRRRHLECESGGKGCLVVVGKSCRRKEVMPRWALGGIRDEVLIYGFLFLFWMAIWQVVRISILGQKSGLLTAILKLQS